MKALIVILCLIYALFLTHMATRVLTTRRSFYISHLRKAFLVRRYHAQGGDDDKL